MVLLNLATLICIKFKAFLLATYRDVYKTEQKFLPLTKSTPYIPAVNRQSVAIKHRNWFQRSTSLSKLLRLQAFQSPKHGLKLFRVLQVTLKFPYGCYNWEPGSSIVGWGGWWWGIIKSLEALSSIRICSSSQI